MSTCSKPPSHPALSHLANVESVRTWGPLERFGLPSWSWQVLLWYIIYPLYLLERYNVDLYTWRRRREME